MKKKRKFTTCRFVCQGLTVQTWADRQGQTQKVMTLTSLAQHVHRMGYCIPPGREGRSRALQAPRTEQGWSREWSGEMGLERVAGGLHPACPWLLALLHGPCWHPGKSPTCPTVCTSCQLVPGGGSACLLLRLLRPQLCKPAGPSLQLMWPPPRLVSGHTGSSKDGLVLSHSVVSASLWVHGL